MATAQVKKQILAQFLIPVSNKIGYYFKNAIL